MIKGSLARLFNRIELLPGAKVAPNFCCLSLTEQCMLKCRMCHKWKDDLSITGGQAPLSAEDWEAAISSIRKITEGDFLINFGGGEPLLYKDLLRLVGFASGLGLRTNIATNAYLIDEEFAGRIGASGLTMINISLDSISEEAHDDIRGRQGVFKRAMQAVELLHKHAPSLKKGICTVISGMNIDGIMPLAEAVQADSRLDWLYFMAAMQPNNTAFDEEWQQKEFSFLWPKKDEARRLIGNLLELKKKGYKIVNQDKQLEAFSSYFASPEKFVKIAECNLSRALHVSSVGDVFICFNHEKLGSIKNDDLESLWRSQRTQQVRRAVLGCKKNCHFLLNCFFEGDFPFSF